MSLRLYFLFLSLFTVAPLWGQQGSVLQSSDSIESVEQVRLDTDSLDTMSQESDSIVHFQLDADSVTVALFDSVASVLLDSVIEEPVVLPEYMFGSTLAAWRRQYPFVDPMSDVMRAAEADSVNPSALLQHLDSVPLNASLNYAQRDLRMPLVLDGRVPNRQRYSISQQAQMLVSRQLSFCMDLDNPYQQQLDYAKMLDGAVYQHSLHHLRSVKRIRKSNTDLPIERKFIDRKVLSGDEQIEAGLGLELDDASLNVEQVVFHADKWHRRGTSDLQISQTALSDNWYKGGDNNMTLSTYDKLVFSRYDESMKTTLDIALELRLSGYYTKADTIHPMRVNDNQFRVDVSYGYKAWKNWYYSSTAYLKTPIFEYFNANSKTVKSNFFAPLEFNAAIGMDLKLTKHKNINYSLMLAPLSYNLKYVADERVSVTSYGIKADRRQLNQVGASITSKLEWKINESVAWSSRAYFFTSYHNTLLEFENTFNVKLGRYSTAKVYLYPRFDDGVDDKLQMKEMLTFGLAFTW